jgi:hypothetical protein
VRLVMIAIFASDYQRFMPSTHSTHLCTGRSKIGPLRSFLKLQQQGTLSIVQMAAALHRRAQLYLLHISKLLIFSNPFHQQ